MIDLSWKDLPVNRLVKTKKGFVWQLLDTTGIWRDQTSMRIWLPEEPGKYNHHDAMKLETDSKRLPTKEEFEKAKEHGIREILDMSGKWFWSASVHPNLSDYAYFFCGGGGYVGYDYRSDDYYSVRCVGVCK